MNLILVGVILSWIIYRKKKGKKIFPKDFLKEQFERTLPYDDPPIEFLAIVYFVGIFFLLYIMMEEVILVYNSKVSYCNQIIETEALITDIEEELDSMVEENELHKAVLELEKDRFEKKVKEYEAKIMELPQTPSYEVLKFCEVMVWPLKMATLE